MAVHAVRPQYDMVGVGQRISVDAADALERRDAYRGINIRNMSTWGADLFDLLDLLPGEFGRMAFRSSKDVLMETGLPRSRRLKECQERRFTRVPRSFLVRVASASERASCSCRNARMRTYEW